MGMLSDLINLFKSKKIFRRNKKDIKIKALAVLLYHLALSYRACSKIIGEIEPVSYESIRNWYTSSKDLFDVEKKERRAIAVDETKIKLENEQIFLWIAIDVDDKKILSVYLSKSRSGLDTILFLKRTLKHCTNKPRIIADKGPWYPWAIKRLGLEYDHQKFGERNAIEQWFSPFKHRIKRFWKRFPYKSSMHSIEIWCLAYVSIYNLWRCLS